MAQAQTITVIDPADFHVHLRQAHTSKLVTPHVKKGGFNLAYVMPNTVPAITTPAQAAGYLAELRKLAPETQFLMTLYLTDKLTPQHIREASGIGIRGVKSYPRGVTTNSDGGVGMEGYAKFDDVFAEMEKVGMVLNLHGEVPSDPNGDGTCVLNAEERFLPHLHEIHRKFPNLKIVLEHVTTSAAVEAVKSIDSPNVAATITPHHLALTIDQVVASSLSFCKPVAKYPTDRRALRDVIRDGHPRFFLGSDSAPHPSKSKLPGLRVERIMAGSLAPPEPIIPSPCAAGIYTSPILLPLVATLFERCKIPLERLPSFVSTFGRDFYGVPANPDKKVTLKRSFEGAKVPTGYGFTAADGPEWVIPFMAGESLGWEIDGAE